MLTLNSNRNMDSRLTCRAALLVFICIYSFFQFPVSGKDARNAALYDEKYYEPTIMIAILVRNKAHTLPWFFGHLENLNYPKDRITIWIRSDHNVDNSSEIIKEWTSAVRKEYHDIDVKIDKSSEKFDDERSPCDWSDNRFTHVMKLREEALMTARKIWADYLFMLDADVILENVDTISILMDAEQTIVAPMLNSSYGGAYSNFWGGMTETGYYKRVEGYFDVIDRKKIGVFEVPMVHTVMLINMKHLVSSEFSYVYKPKDYKGPHDDIIVFGHNVKNAGIKMHIVNTEFFGVVLVPMAHTNSLQDEVDHFIYVKLEAMDANLVDEVKIGRQFPVDRPPLIASPHVYIPKVQPDLLGFDQVYMINLKRRPDRRLRMLAALEELGISVKIMDAVDGKELNATYLKKLGVEMLEGYLDPYHQRPLTMGEIGCFLSHFFIWQDVIENQYQRVIVFEDDVRFESHFRSKVKLMMEDADNSVKDWDLLYLGRKRMRRSEEDFVKGSSSLVWPSYSYWTLSYALSYQGAQKLLDQSPHQKMVPVDEYLPIMFDKHPETAWKESFSPRNLIGLSAEPLLVYPTHYTGEPNYISDTEDSHIIPPDQDVVQHEKAVGEKDEL